ncbi:hypothetical protein G7L40_20805 [Paenibacillus polymyxa]|uniref:Uncharacterized protein n=1 Tax=Paenibacillus polymyxa TaxID=1406 RepID=A0A378XYY4_PAEPO|nr:hypothetical protein [Paenibacillus polymyxa]MBE7896065.1 hypothetical protein [Paenibacillus polymyxa]MBG9765979.1 hypothetical protein [Paenibacillus polymyxa]MCC3256602.1 hypothetical protein [Paenibacillus polymyxa]QPK54913.1 hypothetical protein G7035_20860 [Paenibacillus polymyxa]QPK60001.1 hypothetical protein G7L40_20805 [Paenibacillus polymyxa]
MDNLYKEYFKDQKYRKSFIKWMKYYYETEMYDRSVCNGIDKFGNAAPISGDEYKLINQNAKRLMNILVRELRDNDIDEETWKRARNMASRLSHEQLKKTLKEFRIL